MPFDTHRFFKTLIAAGFSEKQAETLVYQQVNLINSKLATDRYIEALKAETNRYIEALRADTNRHIEASRAGTNRYVAASSLDTMREIADVRRAIEDLGAYTDKRITQAKNETIKWVAGIVAVQTAFLISLGLNAVIFLQSAN